MLRPGEQIERPVGLADRQVRHHALAGLGRGDPRAVAHAPDAALGHHEGVPPLGEVVATGFTAQGAAQHRVVPVHRPAVLGGEGAVRAGAHDLGEEGDRELPVGALVAELGGDGHGAADAVAHRRRTGEQGEGPGGAVGVAGPQDLAAGGLQLEHEVDGPLHHRPQALEEPAVAGEQVAVPDAGGDVGEGVRVELVLLDAVGQVVLVPRAVGPLDVGEPLEAALGLGVETGHAEGHQRLDVVPRVGVAAREPGHHPGGELPLGHARGGQLQVRCAQQARDVGTSGGGHGRPPEVGGFVA